MTRAKAPGGAKAGGAKAGDAPVEQPAANPVRGEHELELGGVRYRLRPSHAALQAIEQRTEQAILSLIARGNAGAMLLRDMGVVGAELIRAGATDELTKRIDAGRIEELIFEEGLPKVMPALVMCLLDAATGGCDASGNAKAAAA